MQFYPLSDNKKLLQSLKANKEMLKNPQIIPPANEINCFWSAAEIGKKNKWDFIVGSQLSLFPAMQTLSLMTCSC